MPQQVKLDYGDSEMEVELPDSATVVKYGVTYNDPPEVDPWEATRKALENPLGMPPLRELAGPGKTAVIAFPDRVKGGGHDRAHRKVCIPLMVEELVKGGMKKEDITLLCAPGLHRKNHEKDMYEYLGKDIMDEFYPDRIAQHDAEDPELLDLGKDEMGNTIQCNHLIAKCDIPIIIGHVQGNPYGGYSGGYKMAVTGLTGWRSIASHHTPSTMHRDDFLPASTNSTMRRQFDSIGKAMEKGIGKKFFAMDAVLGQKAQVLGVYCGAVDEVQKASWPLADRRTNVYLDITEPADILVYGLPRNFHYGPGMGSNPILMLQAIGAQVTRCWRVFKEGGVIIAPSICDGWFNNEWFPSYEATYEKLLEFGDFAGFCHSEYVEQFATDPGYINLYREKYAYHPFHAFSMISCGTIALQRTAAVFIPGAEKPEYARGMGCIPTATFEEAMEQAIKITGNNPNIICTPEAFSGGVGVHLYPKNGKP
jgi:nickel-dependent lactate racemase